MKNRLIFTLVFSLQILPAVETSEITTNVQEIGDNIAATLSNTFKMLENTSTFLTNTAKYGSGILRQCSSFGLKHQKKISICGLALAAYVGWRCYERLSFGQHVNDARYFLGPVLPVADGATMPDPAGAENATLKIRNLDLGAAQTNVIQPYLDRLETLKHSLMRHSKLAYWIQEISAIDGLQNFENMSVAFTEEQIIQVEEFINPRIACLGLPKNYGLLQTPWVWGARISAPLHDFNVRNLDSWKECSSKSLSSYAKGVIFTYEGEATRLTWELFKWEKKLRTRLNVLEAA